MNKLFDEWSPNKFLLGVGLFFFIMSIIYSPLKAASMMSVSLLFFLWSVSQSKRIEQ